MAVRSRKSLRSVRSVPREKRLSANYRRPLWQTSNRPYPKTVFVLHEPLKVYDWQTMAKLDAQHRHGKSNLMWRVTTAIAAKAAPFMNESGKKERLWFSPMRTINAETIGPHKRLIFAKFGNDFVGFKGTGTDKLSIGWWRPFPFGFNPQYTPRQQHFRGGMPYEDALLEAENAVEINNAFRVCLGRRQGFALRAGLLPTFEPLAILKPLQIPEEMEIVEKGGRPVKYTGKQKQSLLAPKAEIPAPVDRLFVEKQAVLVYKCRTPYRVMELSDLPFIKPELENFVSGHGCDKKGQAQIEPWLGLFDANGLELKLRKGELVAYLKGKREAGYLSFTEVRERILDNFIRNLGATIRVVHKELNGTFRDAGETSMLPKDISVAVRYSTLTALDCI